MGHYPFGPVTNHLAASNGPDINMMKFYITEYSSHYGKDGFVSTPGRHVGTGYKSNFRPGVYYSQDIDKLDNPVMGQLLQGNYQSITKKDFAPYSGSDGKDPLPEILHMVPTGFVKDIPRTLPTQKEVHRVHVDPKHWGSMRPKQKPLLHLLNTKDPVEDENALHGPSYMSTECHARFTKHVQPSSVAQRRIGPKEGSGFTHAFDVEPITYRPNEPFDGKLPGWCTSRPTGTSVMKNSYLPSIPSNGSNRLGALARNADRDTGYTREIKPAAEFTARPDDAFTTLSDVHSSLADRIRKQDPAEYVNLTHPRQYPSMTSAAFLGKQRNDQTMTERLGNIAVGTKEATGYTENNCIYVECAETPESLKRFDTNYKTRFCCKNLSTDDVLKNVSERGVMELPDNGFTKSTRVHTTSDVDSSTQLRSLHPYVARSIKSRDPYCDDQTHANKRKILSTA